MYQSSDNVFRLTARHGKFSSATRFALIALSTLLLVACGDTNDEQPVQVPNREPVATDDNFDVAAGANFVVSVLENDSDPDHDTLSIASSTQPEHGVLSLENNELRYKPALTYKGSDEFSYTVTDGEYKATARVIISVTFNELDPTPHRAITGRLG
ncbi:Ig-like domain-containing protein [Alteromonas lipolytica]|nr:Ig-like domain-containing protein [Alteromonas lipolytica]